MDQVRHLVEVFFYLLLLLLLYFVVVVVLLIIFFLLVCFPFCLLLTNYSFARFCDKHNPSNINITLAHPSTGHVLAEFILESNYPSRRIIRFVRALV